MSAVAGGLASSSAPPIVTLFGCRVHALTMAETLAEVERLIASRRPAQHCVLNAAKVVALDADARLRHIVRSCALVNADGQAVVWAGRLLGAPLPERVAGVDLFVALLARAEERGHSVYFLGARREVVDEVVRRARARHPRLRVAGWRDGYFGHGEDEAVVAAVRRAAPDILFVGMPSPRKELWLSENLDALGVPFAMGVGGSFDVYAGLTRRAPAWMQRLGLEWAYRFAQEPRRMWRRYLVGNAAFVRLVVREWQRARRASREGTHA